MEFDRWSAILQRNRLLYPGISLALIAPCYWLPRLEAGDLSGRTYDGWLAQLIENGHASGFVFARQTSNVLFDWMANGLGMLFGAELAQRLAVSIAVLTFAWGAFAFINRVAGRKVWHLMPSIAVLSYGWGFRAGFFNFYMSIGLCFWAMSLAWGLDRRRLPAAAALLLPAYVAHALPVVWAVALLGLAELGRRLPAPRRAALTGAAVIGIVGAFALVRYVLATRWLSAPFAAHAQPSQGWTFDYRYWMLLAALLLLWGSLFLRLLRFQGPRVVVSSVPFHLCVIGAAAIPLLSGVMLVPGLTGPFSYIAEPMSMSVGVCVCALLGPVRPRAIERYALVALSLVFFGLLFQQERALNRFEDQRQQDIIATPALPDPPDPFR